MKHFTVKLVLILFVILGLNNKVVAQEIMDVMVQPEESDCFINFYYKVEDKIKCSTFGPNHQFAIYNNKDITTQVFFTGFRPGIKRNDEWELFRYPVGPDSINTWALSYYENAPCGDIIYSKGDIDDYFSLVETVPLLPPKNVSVLGAPFLTPPGGEMKINQIFWDKGTDYDDPIVSYKIFRGPTESIEDADSIGLVDGFQRSFTDDDSNLEGDSAYYYWVQTCINNPNNTKDWAKGPFESVMDTSNAVFSFPIYNPVYVSKGIYFDRVKVGWPDLSGIADEIRIERSIPEDSWKKEELAVLSKNARTYNDYDAIPGYEYKYTLSIITNKRKVYPFSDKGYRKSNGIIKGFVKSPLGAGVEGISVCAKPTNRGGLPEGVDLLSTTGYCDTTNIEGYYEIKNIYYYDEAEFDVVPYKEKASGDPHEFSPDSVIRTLDLNANIISNVDFTDNSVFSVGGKVTYPPSEGSDCEVPVEGASIIINNDTLGILTDSIGEWSHSIQEEGIYHFTANYLHHEIEDKYKPDNDDTIEINVNTDIDTIDFLDKEEDWIYFKVQDGCEEFIAEKATLKIYSSDTTCFLKDMQVNEGIDSLYLPSMKYKIELVGLPDNTPNIEAIKNQIFNKLIEVDLTEPQFKDTITTEVITETIPGKKHYDGNNKLLYTEPDVITKTTVYDTMHIEVEPSANFIYHSPIDINVSFKDANAELDTCIVDVDSTKTRIIMQQDSTYVLKFEVTEQNGGCPVNEGVLQILDFISDRGDTLIEVPIDSGYATYTVKAGIPNVIGKHDHEKLLYVKPKVGFLDEEDAKEYWILVTGEVFGESSFITRSPAIPWLTLHDPPGDNSYSYVEEGTQIKSFMTLENDIGISVGNHVNLAAGIGVKTPFSVSKFGGFVNYSLEAGWDVNGKAGWEQTLTFNKKFSTSDMENLTGDDGDVYIGAAVNFGYAYGEKLLYDGCKVKIQEIGAIEPTGFATTFIYTENHIKNTSIPTLTNLISRLENENENEKEKDNPNSNIIKYNEDEIERLKYDIINWEKRSTDNARNKENAIFKRNISFSAGAVYENWYNKEESTSNAIEFTSYISSEISVGVKGEIVAGAWLEVDGGYTLKLNWVNKQIKGVEESNNRTVGYVLNDNDIGDFFTVDIKEDIAYGVPAFTLVAGDASCPSETGARHRDKANIEILSFEGKNKIGNVPKGEKATFLAELTNRSPSLETREYHVRVVSTTNPDGANISLGGKQINNNPASFFLDYNQRTNVILTVEKGPLASNYGPIGIMMFPPCEYSLWENNGKITSGDTAWISVDFQNDCSNVSLQLPGDGWLVNQKNDDTLDITIAGYDLYNENLENITFQYKKENGGWSDDTIFYKDELSENFFDYAFDVSELPDGHYQIRAKVDCGLNGGSTYSSLLNGIIDRTSAAPFGIPFPADGFLRVDQEISVEFDKKINCDSIELANIELFTEDSIPIPFTRQCLAPDNQNKFIIVPDGSLFVDSLEGVMIHALVDSVRDTEGHIQEYPTKWSFLVNVNPVFWNPDSVKLTAQETDNVVFNANLANSSDKSKPFTISKWPEWIIPDVTSASILPNNSFTIQLEVVEDLKPGLYDGQVFASFSDGDTVALNITLELYAEEISWKINPSDFEYNMNITAQFSSDGSDTNLSTDLRDRIAAYVEGELRGIGEISYISELDKYAAFINVFSNQSGENGSSFEAEDYVADLSVQDLTLTDNGVISGVTRFKKKDWIEFDIYATKDGIFNVAFRLASSKTGKEVELFVDGILKTTFEVPNTGDLSTYTTFKTSIEFVSGSHVLRIKSKDAEFDLNWFNFSEYHVRNEHSTEVIKFKMWDALNGIEHGAIEELTFFNDGVVGNAMSPFLLHSAGRTQYVPLAKGWTWISINKESPDMSVEKVFESITPSTSLNDIVLKSQANYSEYTQTSGWLGGLSEMDVHLGYLIHLNAHEDMLDIIGNTPEGEISIPLNPKWTWIGYPKPEIIDVDLVLAGLKANPTQGDIIKSQFEFAEYNEQEKTWIGDLDYFYPGRGYKLFASGATNLHLKSNSPDNLHIKHEYNMTLTAKVDLGILPYSEDYKLQAYINDQLRGEASLSYIDKLEENMAFTMIFGDRADIGESVKVVLWDGKNQNEIQLSSQDISFGIDNIKGTIRNPFIFSALNVDPNDVNERLTKFECYPNPFSDQTFISYSIPQNSHVVLTITNSFGAEIARIVDARQTTGNYKYRFDAWNLSPGIYYCTLKTKNYVATKKMIFIKDKN